MTMKTLTDLTKTTYERTPTLLVCHTPAICEKDLLSNMPVTKALHAWLTPCDGCFLTDKDGERTPLACPLVDVVYITLDAQHLLHFERMKAWAEDDCEADALPPSCNFSLQLYTSLVMNLELAFLADEQQLSQSEPPAAITDGFIPPCADCLFI